VTTCHNARPTSWGADMWIEFFIGIGLLLAIVAGIAVYFEVVK
jgi:hypothetical protein